MNSMANKIFQKPEALQDHKQEYLFSEILLMEGFVSSYYLQYILQVHMPRKY